MRRLFGGGLPLGASEPEVSIDSSVAAWFDRCRYTSKQLRSHNESSKRRSSFIPHGSRDLSIRSDIPPLRIQPIQALHRLLIHGKDDTTTQHQPRQPWQRAGPEDADPLLAEHAAGTDKGVAILGARGEALHPRLDRVQRLGHVDGDQAGGAAEGEGRQRPEPLARRHVRLGQLPERRVGAEAGRRVGRLPRRRRHEALEEAAEPAVARDDAAAVEEAAHPWVGGFAVVDSAGVGKSGLC